MKTIAIAVIGLLFAVTTITQVKFFEDNTGKIILSDNTIIKFNHTLATEGYTWDNGHIYKPDSTERLFS